MCNVLSYNQLMSQENNSLQEIRERARVICERRGRYATKISSDVSKIESEIKAIESIIDTIKTSCFVLENEQKEDLETLCKDLGESLKNYLAKASALRTRFNNKKIKVVAFGLKSEGKSTFTRLYTGLPESVVAVKGNNTDQDKTGALSVIYHDVRYTKENPQILVHFRTRRDILNVVNFCVEKLSVLPNFRLPGCTKSGYSTWGELKSVLKDSHQKSIAYRALTSLTDDTSVVDFYAIKSFIMSVFEPESNFSDVLEETHSKKVELADLPLYNDMTNPGERRYLSVERIDISADLCYEDAFENFEICDTKGISAKAGGAMIVEQGLYNDINNSDAAFSIKKVGQSTQATEFYTGLSNNIKKCTEGVRPENLDTKHFAILNLLDSVDDKTINNTIDAVCDNKLAKCIYLGALKDGISYEGEPINAEAFAQNVIIDMLSKIVDSTQTNDDKLIKDCNELLKGIRDNKGKLTDFLDGLKNKADECNLVSILLDRIDEYRQTAYKEVERMAQEHKIVLSNMQNGTASSSTTSTSFLAGEEEEDEEETVTSNGSSQTVTPLPGERLLQQSPQLNLDSNVMIYRMITAEYEMKDEEIKAKLRGCRENEHVIDMAISDVLFKHVKPVAGSNAFKGESIKYATKVQGTASDIGGYIDSVSKLLYEAVRKNINDIYARCKDITDILNLRHELYSAIWRIFKFKELYSDFSVELLKEYASKSPVLDEWFKNYGQSKKDLEASAIVPADSYNILKAYFSKCDYRIDLGVDPVVDWELLKKAICEVYRAYDFKGRVNEKITNVERLTRNVFEELRASLKLGGGITAGIIGMYNVGADKLKEAGVITAEENARINSREKWDNLNNASGDLKAKDVTSLSAN